MSADAEEPRPSQSALRLGRKTRGSRKTVTFGDASEVSSSRLWVLISLACLMLAWYLVTRGSTPILDEKTFPSQGQAWDAFRELWNDGYRRVTLRDHAWASLSRVGKGMIFGVLIGVPVGFAMGLSTRLRGFFDPIVESFRTIPPLALLPLFIMWFGIGEASKVNLLIWASVWIMIIASRAGVLGVRGSKVHAAYSLGANRWQILRYVILPNALPEIFTGARVALGVSWGTLVAAELTGTDRGLGAMIYVASRFFRMDIVVVSILIISFIGVAMDMVMRFLEARLIPWRGKG
ncbi:MAG: ABC transporter permease [Actinomycetota bacterium]|nr:ABC transporter permease [Actinomycetota bacterium]